MPVNVVTRYVGEPNVPQDVKRRRRQIHDVMLRLGSPVLIKHMFDADDVLANIAKPSPAFDPIYGQTRNEDPLSYGVGYVSSQNSPNEWIKPDGSGILVSEIFPGQGYLPAPLYRGYGPGYLTYAILPDTPVDVFKLTQAGALIKTQTATAQAGWFPSMNDNDLLINVQLDEQGNIIKTLERYLLKQSQPTTMRGLNRKGQREGAEHGGNQFVINQSFQLSLVPENNILTQVETDR